MSHSHGSIFIVLALGVAILASWTALGLLERVRENHEFRRVAWLIATGLCMGGGIWAMHFIAMQGFNPGAAVRYNTGLTLLSFVLAAVGTCGAFWAAANADISLRNLLIASGAMGASIALMHYVGMAAVRTEAVLHYHPLYVALSIIVAVLASGIALFIVRSQLNPQQRILAAVVLGMAISLMHYIGMTGITVELPANLPSHSHASPSLFMAIATTAVAITLMGGALATAHLDRRIRFLSVLDAGDIGYWEVQLPARQLWLSPYARMLLSSSSKDDLALASKTLVDIAIAMAKKSLRNPESTVRRETEIQIGKRWITVRGRMIHHRRPHHIKMAGVLLDITESHTVRTALEVSDARQKLLLNELNHRLKNNFASIQSIAALTARGSADLPSFIETFQSRLLALSNTQTLLTQTGWESADIAAIFKQELNPYTERAIIEGPTILLDPKRALSMGLIAHELTTNAAKHGALKQSEGAIHVRWTHPSPEGHVRLEWIETGGPPVSAPSGKGFGSRLIRSSIEGPLGGTAQIDYPPAGLRVTLNFQTRELPQTAATKKGASVAAP